MKMHIDLDRLTTDQLHEMDEDMRKIAYLSKGRKRLNLIGKRDRVTAEMNRRFYQTMNREA